MRSASYPIDVWATDLIMDSVVAVHANMKVSYTIYCRRKSSIRHDKDAVRYRINGLGIKWGCGLREDEPDT